MIDSGILGEPGCAPDFTHEEVAAAGDHTLAEIRGAGSRGAAVALMQDGVRALVVRLFAEGRVHGVLCLGGAEGALLGAAAMQALPVGVPKLLVSPSASGRRTFAAFVGESDVCVMHSVVDILGLNGISRPIFDNAAAAMAGMVHDAGSALGTLGEHCVGVTMLGQTTPGVMRLRESLVRAGHEPVIFHANGVGGPAMEHLCEEGALQGVVDYTLSELANSLMDGIHATGPERLTVAGRCGLPQVVVPGCVDFFNQGPRDTVPEQYRSRKSYFHNPVATLVRLERDEEVALGALVAERLNGVGRTRSTSSRRCAASRWPTPRAATCGTRSPTARSWTRCRRTCARTSRSRPSTRTSTTTTSPMSSPPATWRWCRNMSERPVSNCLLDLAPPDIAYFQERSDIVLVPIGSCEQHGAHLPLGTDTITALEVSRRAAAKADVPYTAPLWIGYSPQHMRETSSGVGTITVRASTLNAVLYDILRSLIHHGWNKLILVNGHGSNTKVLDPLLRRIKYETGALVALYKPYAERYIGILEGLLENPPEETPGWHASELETSQVLAHNASLVRMDRAADDRAQAPDMAAGLVPEERRRARRAVRGLPVLHVPDGPRRVLAHGRDRQPDAGDGREGRGGARALLGPSRAGDRRVPRR